VRELADAERIRRFMRALGAEADTDGAAYLGGGATAVLLGWRAVDPPSFRRRVEEALGRA
jgi:hypothetical protein